MFTRLLVAAALAVPALAAIGPVASVSAATPVCRDSNGSRPGGSVYVAYGRGLACDLVHGQRLHVTRVPSAAACDGIGGRYSARARICWDADF